MATVTHGEPLVHSSRITERQQRGELTSQQVAEFERFLQEVDRDLLHHRIIIDNAYSRWFREGDGDRRRAAALCPAVLGLLESVPGRGPAPGDQRAHAPAGAGREGNPHERAGRHLPPRGARRRSPRNLSEEAKDREGDPELVSTEGTVDGGTFRFRAAHFEWLLAVAEGLGLDFNEIGTRRHGSPSTLHFCDELQRLYGNEDAQVAEGASFAVENWAAAGFWQDLEDGFLKIKRDRHPDLRIAFFTWHNRVEAQHAGHTMEELEDVYFRNDFDADKFFQGGQEVLDAIAVFWDGLNGDRVSGRLF